MRDVFSLESVFPDAVRILSYCMMGHGRDEGYVTVGPRQIVELHIATGLVGSVRGLNGSAALGGLDTELLDEDSSSG